MDREKFTQEVLKSENTMYHIAKGMLKSESDCEDVVSEAVLKAYTKIHTLKEEKYFKTWLIRILINECYKKLREYKRVVSIEDCNNSFEYKDNSNYTELYNAVKKLKHKIRIVIMLHYIEGYSVEEVGNILKIPVGTVKSRLHIGDMRLELGRHRICKAGSVERRFDRQVVVVGPTRCGRAEDGGNQDNRRKDGDE